MREILFRGRTIEGKEWINGSFAVYSSTPFIGAPNSYGTMLWFAVDPETVGQFTGLTDKNGKKIFEGDIFVDVDGAMDGIPRMVLWDEMHMEFKSPLVKKHWAYGTNPSSLRLNRYRNIEVIGNIHDNPELLEVEE